MTENDPLDGLVDLVDWPPERFRAWEEQVRYMDPSDRDRVVWAFLLILVESIPHDGDPFLRSHIRGLRECALRAAQTGYVVVDSVYMGKPEFRHTESLCHISDALAHGAEGVRGRDEFFACLGHLMGSLQHEGVSGLYSVLMKAAKWVFENRASDDDS